MTLVLIVMIVAVDGIALYNIARNRSVDLWGSTIIGLAGAGGAGVVALTYIFLAPIRQESSIAPPAALAPQPAYQAPTSQLMTLNQAKHLKLDSRRADGGIDNFGSATYDAALHEIRVQQNDPFTISGWAASLQDKSLGSGVLILLDGKLLATATYGIDRFDVATFYKVPEVRYCGFRAKIPALSRGRHTLSVALGDSDRTTYHVLSTLTLIVDA